MDNRLFIKKCFICGEPNSVDDPLELLPSDGDVDEDGRAYATAHDWAHRECYDDIVSRHRD